jgi:hypothetical protein
MELIYIIAYVLSSTFLGSSNVLVQELIAALKSANSLLDPRSENSSPRSDTGSLQEQTAIRRKM